MAIAYLRLTEYQFWNMVPRTLLTMIDEWEDIETARATKIGAASRGAELTLKNRNRKQVVHDVHPFFF